MTYIGIDPGINGGLAVIEVAETGEMTAHAYTLGPHPLVALRAQLALRSEPFFVAIEGVHAFPKCSAKSTTTALVNYGKLLGCLETLGIPHTIVSCKSWQKHFGIKAAKGLKGPARRKAIKAQSIDCARSLFSAVNLVLPGCKREHDGMADALLICEYGRQWCTGQMIRADAHVGKKAMTARDLLASGLVGAWQEEKP